MLHAVAGKMIDKLYLYGKLPVEKRNVYIYGLELTLSMIGAFSTIVLWSIIFQNIWLSFTFFYFFVVTRLFSGGYHAETYTRCYLVTNGTFVISVIIATFIKNSPMLCVLLAVISQMAIAILSPVQNQKHPLSDHRLLLNKRICIVLAICNIALLYLLYLYNVQGMIYSMAVSSLLAVLFYIVYSKLFQKGGN